MQRWPARVLAVLAGVAIVTWVALAALRAGHPFELEWQEGGMLAHLARVRAGEALYAPPGLEFMAFPYPPLYVWVAKSLGGGFLALRLVSIAATVVLLGLLFAHTRRATGSPLAGLAAAGTFAAAYRWAGAWFDVGRVDMLALALALGALHVARFREGARGAAQAGALLGLACLTKQTALLVAGPLLVPLLLRRRREAAAFGALALAVGGGGAAALHLASQGWSSWYLFGLLAGHPWFEPKLAGFWTQDLVWLAPALALGLVAARRDPFLWAPVLGMLAAAWLGRAHQGGYDNTLLPAALAAALLVGAAVGRAGPRPALLALATLQLLLLVYDPRDQVPSAADRAAGERVVARLAGIEGPVFAPHQGYLAVRAGHAPSVHAMAVIDLLSSRGSVERARAFVSELEAALATRRWAAVLLAEPWPDLAALERHYRRVEDLLEGEPDDALRPVTGADRRPRLLYR